MDWLHDPVAAAAALPALVLPLFILLSAALEYLVPPYWGDLFVLAGFFLAGQGAGSLALLFAAALGGSLLGALGAYLIGRRYGLRLLHRKAIGGRRSRTRDRLHDLFHRFGERVLLLNRFLPFVRGLMLYGAGGFGLRLGPSMAYTTVSNVAWIGLLLGLGALSAETFEEIESTFRHASRVLGIGALAVCGLWLSVVLLRSRLRRLETSE